MDLILRKLRKGVASTDQTMLIAAVIRAITGSRQKSNPSAAGQESEGACLRRQQVSVNQVQDGQLFLSWKGQTIQIVLRGLPHTANTPF
ncbi:hypothetical protein [Spirosoma radiotolerans]|uniref:Uncharacterized protein n=1 Tax=Spirosoma radiotolerans TaxID=1379870 RepID=A0A0E3V6W3_9BACT|nr:hypothetical protein [Spirosoma radiotolerans]AKD54891.1 hypothetical protein SD10_08235 [Spirosoma radiotolerans]